MAEPRLFLDISRLVFRSTASSATGVDRVLLAYAKWLETSQLPCEFLYHSLMGFKLMQRDPSLHCIDLLDKAWQGQNLKSSPIFPTINTGKKWRCYQKWKRRKDQLKQLEQQDPLTLTPEELELFDLCADSPQFKLDKSALKAMRNGIFLSTCHSTLSRSAYLQALDSVENLKKVFFIHDLIPLDYPEYCRAGEAAKHLLRIRNAYQFGDHLIVNSRYTADRLEHWRSQLGLPEIPVTIAHIGVEEHLSIPAGNTTTDPYFVTIGTVEPRKNHLLLLNIWRELVQELPPERIPTLKIIGKSGWENESVERMLSRHSQLKPHVEQLTQVGDTELSSLLSNCTAMLFPSFVEGWGMPLVEALSNGTPAIAADIPALREAGQDLADYISPIAGDAWKSTILDYAAPSSKSRNQQIDRLSGFSAPSWGNHFTKVKEVLDQLSNSAILMPENN